MTTSDDDDNVDGYTTTTTTTTTTAGEGRAAACISVIHRGLVWATMQYRRQQDLQQAFESCT